MMSDYRVLFFADDETEQAAEGEEEKDVVTFYISNAVQFSNPKMTRYDGLAILLSRCETGGN